MGALLASDILIATCSIDRKVGRWYRAMVVLCSLENGFVYFFAGFCVLSFRLPSSLSLASLEDDVRM